jgi:hypothetical protein
LLRVVVRDWVTVRFFLVGRGYVDDWEESKVDVASKFIFLEVR